MCVAVARCSQQCSDIRVKVIDKERTLLTREYARMAYTFKYICRRENACPTFERGTIIGERGRGERERKREKKR